MQKEKSIKEIQAAIIGYFDENTSNDKKTANEKFLKSRIRPVMEYLIELEDTRTMSLIEPYGWFGEVQLDGFLKMAQAKGCFTSFAWLLKLKCDKYGFKDKDFSL